MAQSPTVVVRHSRVWAILFIVLSSLNLVLGALSGTGSTLFVGAILLPVGILMLLRPYVQFGPDDLAVKNVLGMTLVRYPFGMGARFSVDPERPRLWYEDGNGVRKRVRVSRVMADRGDWDKLVAAVQARDFD